MEQFEIERKGTRFTYLIKDNNIEFYLIIPNNNRVSIVLNIMEAINNDKVKNIPEFMDKVLVIPVLNQNIINYLKTPASSYNQADNYFSNLINTSYKILTHNKITVEPLVYLNNDTLFSNFNTYFVNKFNGRVSLINLNISNQTVSSIASSTPVNTVFEEKKEIPQGLDAIYSEEITLKSDNNTKKDDNKKEPGFVSYVLLGVMIAILSLIFLYMLL